MPPIVIAEIGENHIGDMDIARTLILKAAQAGADYVKFQSYRPQNFKKDDPEYDWFCKVALSDENHVMLKREADKAGIKFLSSPFSLERARFLCEYLHMKEIKIASGMMMNIPILEYINDHAKTVFLSTGLATIPEIRKALSYLNRVKKCYILHCVTQYPCSDKDANLLAIKVLQDEFPENDIGYSDHTVGIDAAILAVALGAKVIEKHLTFDKNASEGTDHVLSVDPEELSEMVRRIQQAEKYLGRREKIPTEDEKRILDFVRNRFMG